MSGTANNLRVLRREVDRGAGALAAEHGDRLRCRRGCHDCCVDGLTVFDVEAQAIREAFPELLAQSVAHPPGKCAFLDEQGACRIYTRRPYVCRTQGLPLRWFTKDETGGTVEYRDICPLNESGGPPLTDLPESSCWAIGPWEGRLAGLQREHGTAGVRVSLRSLFASGAQGSE